MLSPSSSTGEPGLRPSSISNMHSADPQVKVVLVIGPTAVGKSRISIALAGKLGGEIVSADSRLFYRGMDIGTDKPSAEDRARIPHHLIDIADPDRVISLAEFLQVAQAAIEDITQRGKIPFVVGGTGLYVRALTEGWQPPRQEADPELREELERLAAGVGSDGLHRRLQAMDPEAAAMIDPQNTRRTIRALEVTYRTGIPFSAQRIRSGSGFQGSLIGLQMERQALYERIDQRLDEMLQAGFVEEVRRLVERGFSPDIPAFSAIGYREIASTLTGELTLEAAVARMKKRSRQLVRRQQTWFRKIESPIEWFSVDGTPDEEVVDAIAGTLVSERAQEAKPR